MRPSLLSPLVVPYIYVSVHFVKGALVNITVDDTLPDPLTGNTFRYAPSDRWNLGNNCSGCAARPEPSFAHDGTWHDATYSSTDTSMDETQTAQIQFNGSAIYVFGILWQTTQCNSEISFLIDGQIFGSFTYMSPSNNGAYAYNVCLWANDSIGPGLHTFALQNGQAGGMKSLILLDYIIYSQERDEITPGLSEISSMVVSSSTSFQQSSTSFFQQTGSPISSSDAHPAATPSVAPKAANNVRTVALASVVPSVVAIAIFILCVLQRRRIGIRGNKKSASPSEEKLPTEDTRSVSGRNSTSSQGRSLHSTLGVPTASSNELSSYEESSESSFETAGSSDAGAFSEPGSQWQNRPRTPGGGFDFPLAYQRLSSSPSE